MRAALVAVGLFLLLGGCGGGGEPAAGDTAPRADLRITVWPDGRGGQPSRATLSCDFPGGGHPHPDRACRALFREPGALEPVPADAVCTQIYGGAQEADVEGTLDGRHVKASLNRRNGCEIARWDRLAPVFELEGS